MSERSTFCQRLATFASSTDVHGVRFIVNTPDTNLCRRFVWLLALLLSFAFLGLFFYSRVDYFLQFKTTTSLTYVTDDIPLPSVTVCAKQYGINITRLSASDVLHAQSRQLGQLDLNTDRVLRTASDGRRYINKAASKFFKNVVADKSVILSSEADMFFNNSPGSALSYIRHQETENNCQLLKICLNWVPLVLILAEHDTKEPVAEERDYNYRDVFLRAGKSAEELHLTAECHHGKTQCPGWSRELRGGDGYCYTINTTNTVVVDMSSDLLMMDSAFADGRKRTEKVSVDVFLNYDGKDLIRKHVRPQTLHGVIEGFTHKVAVMRTIEKVSPGPPYSAHCGGNDQLTTPSYNGLYSSEKCRATCVETCREELVLKYGCRPDFTVVTPAPFCDLSVTTVSNPWDFDRQNSTCVTELCGGRCPKMACDEWIFQTEVDRDKIDERGGASKIEIVVTASGTAFFMTIAEDPFYTVGALLAELGGTTGLFVGMSLLTLLHCTEFILLELLAACRRGTNEPTTETNVG